MALQKMAQDNFIAAQWWWSLLKDYSSYLTQLSFDPLMEQRFTEADWAQVWDQSAKMYFKGGLETAKTYLRQAKYREAMLTDAKAQHEPVVPLDVQQIISPLLEAKLSLCEAMAHTGLGDAEKGGSCLKLAAYCLYSSAVNAPVISMQLLRMLSEELQLAINEELIKLNSPYRCRATPPTSKAEARIDYPAGIKNRSFWEWLDLPEE
jgi:hypothetical protein